MMKKIASLLIAAIVASFQPAFAGTPTSSGVQQVGSVTAGHMPVWNGKDSISDSGIPIGTGGVILPPAGGTGTSTTFTQNSIVFAGASGNYAQDNAQFFWDDTHHSFSVGGFNPSAVSYPVMGWLGSSFAQSNTTMPATLVQYIQNDYVNLTLPSGTTSGATVARYSGVQVSGTGSTNFGGHPVGQKGEVLWNGTGGNLDHAIGDEGAIQWISGATGAINNAAINTSYFVGNNDPNLRITTLTAFEAGDYNNDNAGIITTMRDFHCHNTGNDGSGTVTNSFCLQNEDPKKVVYTAGASQLLGDVSIGTTSVNGQMTIIGTTGADIYLSASGSVPTYIAINGQNSNNGYAAFEYGGADVLNIGASFGGEGFIFDATSGGGQVATFGFGTVLLGKNSNQLVLPSTGNVGIGTSIAGTALTVNGTVTATTFSGSGASLTNVPASSLTGTLAAGQFPALTGDVTTSSGSVATTVAKIAGVTVGTPTGTGNVVMSASPTLTGTVSAVSSNWSGNVGIGTTSPVAKLDVYGAINIKELNAVSFPADGTAVGQSVAVGAGALNGQTTSTDDVAVGYHSFNVSNGNYDTGLGVFSGASATTSGGLTAIGYSALAFATGGLNTGLGYLAGDKITTGASNLVLGANIATTTLTTGSGNILIGTQAGVDTQLSSSSNTLNIGNLIYGTGLATSGTASSGSVGIGTASPIGSSTLTINGVTAFTGTAPTCGTGCASITATSTNARGSMVSSSSVSSITLNFATSGAGQYSTTPFCTISDSNSTAVSDISAVSSTALTVSLASALSAVTVYYICQQ